MRGKAYYQLGKKYINEARFDFMQADTMLAKVRKMNMYLMRLKIHYAHGLLELEHGADIQRALYHFNQFLSITELFQSKRDIRKQMPEFNELEESCNEHIR